MKMIVSHSVAKGGLTLHEAINPLLYKYSFRRIGNKWLLKTLWEKKKLLVTSNPPFPTMFSTQSENSIPIYPCF